VAAILAELRARGVQNSWTLAYQSRVGPVEWLKPYTDESIRCGSRPPLRAAHTTTCRPPVLRPLPCFLRCLGVVPWAPQR